MAIEKLCSLMSKKSGENVVKFMKTVMSGVGKETSILEGKAIQQLPEELSVFTNGLKKPKVMLGLKSSNKGSGVAGVKILDGNKMVNAFAMGLDTTRGTTPILQIRGRGFADGKKTDGLSVFFNPNAKIKPSTCGKVEINRGTNKTFELYTENNELAQAFHYNGSGAMSEMAKDYKNLKPSTFNNEAKSFKDFWISKGKAAISASSCEKELLQIATRKSKPTIKSVTQAKDILVKKMGYDPKLLSLESKSAKEMGYAAAAFDPTSGKIFVSEELLAKGNNTEIALLLSHELQHMDDFVKLSKSIGVKGLQKLHPDKINGEFYEKMAKYSGEPDFDVKQIVKDIKTYYSPSKYKGHYQEILHEDVYALSALECRAREAEKKVLDLLRKKGIEVKTEANPMELYAQESSSALHSALKRLEPYLPKEGRDKFFNRRYIKAYKKLEPELYEIEKKMAKGLPSEEFAKLEKQAEKIRSKYINEQLFKRRVLEEMEEMLSKN